MPPIAEEGALNHGYADRLGPGLRGRGLVQEAARQAPGRPRVVVVSDVVIDDVALRDQKIEVAFVAPCGLNQHRVASYSGERLTVGKQRERAVPVARVALEGPEVHAIRFPGYRRAH